jgi:TetR/AcrR family transcriptional regulator, transcriptional repressor for nem operon
MGRAKVFNEEMILDKAMNLFWQKGYNATSAQDLVDGLGISRSSMYDTYGDKHSLFVKTLKQYRKERIDPVIDGVDGADDIEAYIRSVFEAVKEDAIGENRARGCFLVNSAVELAAVDKDVAVIANSILQDTENAITKAIMIGQKKGIFTKKNSAQSMSRFIFNSLNGLRVTMKFDTDNKMFDDIVHVCLSALKA